MSTYRTWWRASVRITRSGSNGAISDTPGVRHEAAHGGDLAQPVLRGKPKNARDVLHHVALHGRAGNDLCSEIESRGPEQALEGVPARAGPAVLDAGDDGLGRAGASGQRTLGEFGTCSRRTQEGGGTGSMGHG